MNYYLRIFCVEDIKFKTMKLVSFFFGLCHGLLTWCPAGFDSNERKTYHCKDIDSKKKKNSFATGFKVLDY